MRRKRKMVRFQPNPIPAPVTFVAGAVVGYIVIAALIVGVDVGTKGFV